VQRIMCHAKLHRVRATECRLDYEGSITIDADLLSAANLFPGERVLVANLTNGQRFETYTISGPRGSGVICLNGGCARLAEVGDELIVLAFAVVDEAEARKFRMRVVWVDEHNRPVNRADRPAEG